MAAQARHRGRRSRDSWRACNPTKRGGRAQAPVATTHNRWPLARAALLLPLFRLITLAPNLAQIVVGAGSRRLVAAHTAAAPPAPTKRVLQAGGTTVLRHPGTAGFCTGHGVQVARLGSPNQTRAPFQNVQCALGLPARALQLAPPCFRTVCIETRAGPPRSVVADAQNMTTRFPDRCEQVRTHF